MKTTETTVVLPPATSIEIKISSDELHRPLAPLASSETFSDVGSIYRDDQQKKDLPVNKGKTNPTKKSTPTIKNNDFDSLEILFDFQSSDLSNDVQTDIIRSPESPCRIRFSENTQIINATKVE